MNEHPTLHKFFQEQAKELELKWLAGKDDSERIFTSNENNPKGSIVGYFNPVHASQVQILGQTEIDYLNSLPEQKLQATLEQLFGTETIVVILADGCMPIGNMLNIANKNNIGLLQTILTGEHLVYNLGYYFSHLLAKKVTLHGVFMEVLSIGVLLSGESGIGKSELALELITRGHRLIADDAPLFARIAPNIIIGTSPSVIQDFLEVRGLGVLNIRRMYGDTAIKMSKYLKFIIHIQESKEHDANQEDRLVAPEKSRNVLGMDIPYVDILLAPGRNLGVLVEAAVRNHLLHSSDYYADKDIIARQLSVMKNI
ncbi:MAG: HPr(Ser) kinase/phosphatase [Candidatus Oxydemutatoraceae bacterium WSBS_2016_MAG_OTU14]